MSKKNHFGMSLTFHDEIRRIHVELTGNDPTEEWVDDQMTKYKTSLTNNEGKFCNYKKNILSSDKPTKTKSSTKGVGGQTQGRYIHRDAMREKNPKIGLQEMKELWDSMTEEEQMPYKEKAKEHNMRLKNSTSSDDDTDDDKPVKKTKSKKKNSSDDDTDDDTSVKKKNLSKKKNSSDDDTDEDTSVKKTDADDDDTDEDTSVKKTDTDDDSSIPADHPNGVLAKKLAQNKEVVESSSDSDDDNTDDE